MGFWDYDTVSLVSKKSHHGKHSSAKLVRKKSKSRSRSRSRSGSRHHSHHNHHGEGHHGSASVVDVAASLFGGESHHHKHNSSKASFFGIGGNASRGSFFGVGES